MEEWQRRREARRSWVAEVRTRTRPQGMTRPVRAEEERRFLRALGWERRYGGLLFLEVPDPQAPAVREISRWLEERFGPEEERAYLVFLHEPKAGLGGECPHELLAHGEAERVLLWIREGDQAQPIKE